MPRPHHWLTLAQAAGQYLNTIKAGEIDTAVVENMDHDGIKQL